jgi:hypothetical protein
MEVVLPATPSDMKGSEAAPPISVAEGVEVHIGGEISGQVAIGNNILQIGSVHGGVVNVAMPEQRPQPRPRPTPVFLRPRPFPGLLDRDLEVRDATRALRSGTPVAFHGQAGLGKTALLRHLAHHGVGEAFPDGVVYLSARRQGMEDLLQSLYDVFYESEVSFKATEGEVRQGLGGRRALIIMDDVELGREEVGVLLDAAPESEFVLASSGRCLWEGRAIGLEGLPARDGVALVEREMGRELDEEERGAAEGICQALEGHPLRILQAAAMVREERLSLEEVARWVESSEAGDGLTEEMVGGLPEAQRRTLAVLASLGGATLSGERIGEIAGLADVTPVLEGLERRGLVQSHSPRYSLAGGVGEVLAGAWKLEGWRERALAGLTRWAEGVREPEEVVEEAEGIAAILEWAVGAGRWEEVVRLGRAVEGGLALGGRWGAWGRILEWVREGAREGARSLGDEGMEAWALHQGGTRALCLGEEGTARRWLVRALRLREGMGDEAGAAVTRHNLDLLLGPPGPPEASEGGEAAPTATAGAAPAASGVPLFIKAALAFLAVALLSFGGWYVWPWSRPTPTVAPTETPTPSLTPSPTPSITPTPPTPVPPQVGLWLTDGCDEVYVPGDVLVIGVKSSVDGAVDVYLVDPQGARVLLFGEEVLAGQVVGRDWDVPGSAGGWALEADLNDGQAGARCDFAVEVPPPEAEAELWLTGGCGEAYAPGEVLEIQVRSSVDGAVDIYLVDPQGARVLLFGEEVLAGQVVGRDWDVPDSAGGWALEADLNDGQAGARCDFAVEEEVVSAPSEIRDVWVESVLGESICPGDKVMVYVEIVSESGLQQVEMRARLAGAEGWDLLEMRAIDDQTYEHQLTAQEEPGTEFFIRAMDMYDNAVESGMMAFMVYLLEYEECVPVLETHDVDRPGADYTSFDLSGDDPALCREACVEDPQCAVYAYVRPGVQATSARCWLKFSAPSPVSDGCCISGIKISGQ